ncbi:MAG: UDP-N-acetylmuramate dehydrogenase [Endomicrobium sp.]|jgi:UDP-N-acetylmuramate dehydrogenase|nr:UDP-N-acetylmuramate dehydrogenase [Endomicrobium sp.]
METRRRAIDSNLIQTLSSLGCRILKDEPLSEHCSFKIGGPVDFFVEIPNEQALLIFLNNVKNKKNVYFILGSGTNVLFPDEGYRGTIISLTGTFREISVFNEEILSGSGALMSDVLNTAIKNNLTGLECTAGIPGTVGGAVFGNAGSKNKWIGSFVKNVEVYKNLKKESINKEKIAFSYRKSGLGNCIITSVSFFLKKDIENDNLEMICESMKKRLRTQPLIMPSAGSIFKNLDGCSVGELIEKLGLKGIRAGGAQISEVHGNFIVNTGGASAKDVVSLIKLVKAKVKEEFNINLETEIRIIK